MSAQPKDSTGDERPYLVTNLNAKGGRFGIRIAEDADAMSEAAPVKLGLRTVKFEREIAAAETTADRSALAQELVQVRHDTHLAKYRAVIAWVRLRGTGSWWEDFKCGSAEEFLVRLDLPIGRTLALLESLVRLFSRETFLVVGPDLLGEMELKVTEKQADPELRIRDYAAIFANYTKEFGEFDQVQFRRHVHWYLYTAYPPPAPPVAPLVRPFDPTMPPPRAVENEWQVVRRRASRVNDDATITAQPSKLAHVEPGNVIVGLHREESRSSLREKYDMALHHVSMLLHHVSMLERDLREAGLPVRARPSILKGY
jgi:hypothetical protein